MTEAETPKVRRILSLDGGGAKGFYTIGVLKGLEGLLGAPLHKHFDLIFGTSTGSIIAALVCLGYPIDEVHQLYREHVVKVMGKWFPWTKSQALRELAAVGDADGARCRRSHLFAPPVPKLISCADFTPEYSFLGWERLPDHRNASAIPTQTWRRQNVLAADPEGGGGRAARFVGTT